MQVAETLYFLNLDAGILFSWLFHAKPAVESLFMLFMSAASGDKPEPPSMPTNVLFAMSMNSIRKISSVDGAWRKLPNCKFACLLISERSFRFLLEHAVGVLPLFTAVALAASYDLDFYCNFVWRDDRLHTKLVQGLGFDPAADFQPAPEFLNAADDTGIEVRAARMRARRPAC